MCVIEAFQIKIWDFHWGESEGYQSFGGPFSLHHQGEDKLLPDYSTLLLRRRQTSRRIYLEFVILLRCKGDVNCLKIRLRLTNPLLTFPKYRSDTNYFIEISGKWFDKCPKITRFSIRLFGFISNWDRHILTMIYRVIKITFNQYNSVVKTWKNGFNST